MDKQELIIKSIFLTKSIQHKSRLSITENDYESFKKELVIDFNLKKTAPHTLIKSNQCWPELTFQKVQIMSSTDWEENGVSFGCTSTNFTIGFGFNTSNLDTSNLDTSNLDTSDINTSDLNTKEQIKIYSIDYERPFDFKFETEINQSDLKFSRSNYSTQESLLLIENARSLGIANAETKKITKYLDRFQRDESFALAIALGITICSCEGIKTPPYSKDSYRDQKDISQNIWDKKGLKILESLYRHFAYQLQILIN